MVKPLSHAPIALIEGEQGSGKSTVAVARIVDHYFKRAVEIYLEEKGIVAEVLSYNVDSRVARIKQHNIKKSITIPPDYKLYSDLKVFTNFHLYGIRFKYCTLPEILALLQDGTLSNGRLTVDEAYIASNAQETLSAFTKAVSKFSMTARKRHLHMDFLYPHSRMATWITRWAWAEHIMCSYDENRRMITLDIQRKGYPRPKTIRLYAPPYWRYYDTDELFKLTQDQIGRAVANAQ